MPLLIAPVFNSSAPYALSVELNGPFRLVAGNDKLYELAARCLRNQMDENRFFFDKKVTLQSLFLIADYPHMKVQEDREYIQEVEHRLNLSTVDGVCSIPYVITYQQPAYGITYLKRSLDGDPILFAGRTQQIFQQLLQHEGQFPTVAYRRYLLSLEKETLEDQLLDLWIALESIFVPDGKKGEIMYKLRYRIAYFFADTFQERQTISAFVRESYNHRSEIVHSGKVIGESLKEEVRTLRRMVRAALINMFLERLTPQELRSRLDELILSGETYQLRHHPVFFEPVVV